MKLFSAKTIEDAINLAAQDLGLLPNDVNYLIHEEKKGLFKKVTIEVFELSDVIKYAENYLSKIGETLNIEIESTSSFKDDIIHLALNSDHNSILIGKNGRTLQALNEITRLALSNKFKRRYRVLLDINEYKNGKYSKAAYLARSIAKEVQKTKIDATLDPMPADERRIVHNALTRFSHIKTESIGEGVNRAVVIKYVE